MSSWDRHITSLHQNAIEGWTIDRQMHPLHHQDPTHYSWAVKLLREGVTRKEILHTNGVWGKGGKGGRRGWGSGGRGLNSCHHIISHWLWLLNQSQCLVMLLAGHKGQTLAGWSLCGKGSCALSDKIKALVGQGYLIRWEGS